MFVQDFKTIDGRYEEVAARLVADIEALLEAALDSARDAGERLQGKVGPASWPMVLAKTVKVRPGPVRERADGVLVAFSWEAAGGASLFPRLDADLEATPFGPEQTVLALRGRYEPPAGLLGRLADQLLSHRLAESTIRDFLDNVCASLTHVRK